MYIYICINFLCQCSMSIYISKIRHLLLTSYISVSSKPSKTQYNNEKCKKYKSDN